MALVLYLLANICVAALFKLFPRFHINALHAIVINYTVCFILGSALDPNGSLLPGKEIIGTTWFKFDVLLGLVFVTGFTLTAKAIATAGITVTTMMQKMSILLTVPATVLLFHQPFGLWQLTGLCLAIVAIIAITRQNGQPTDLKLYVLPGLVLIIGAIIEVILFYVEKHHLGDNQHYTFTSYGFGFAALFGWFVILYNHIRFRSRITKADVVSGILLGLPNFLTIFLLLLMLNKGWNPGILYPILNVTVLILTTLTAWLMFKEKLNRINWAGIALAVIAILMIGFMQT